MRTFNMHEAKTNLSKLVDDVLHGEEIIIALSGKPVAKLIPMPPKKTRRAGVLKGKIKIGKDFDDPLSEDILKDFEGES